MKQAIKELEYCIVRERNKIANKKEMVKYKPGLSDEYNKSIEDSESNIKEFKQAISVLNKSINE